MKTGLALGVVLLVVSACSSGGSTGGAAAGDDPGASSGSSGSSGGEGRGEDGGSADPDEGNPPRTSCTNDEALCPKGCAKLETDLRNCGSCGNVCQATSPGNARAACIDGSCQSVCDQGQLCGRFCVDTKTDPNNCGACRNKCDTSGPSGAEGVCLNGKCGFQCTTAGESLCADRCRDTASDPQSCGACGRSCSDTAPSGVVGAQCSASKCTGMKSSLETRACTGAGPAKCPQTTCDAICAALGPGSTCTSAYVLFRLGGTTSTCTTTTTCGTSLESVPRCGNPNYPVYPETAGCSCDQPLSW